jgi:PAS domain-containing protein
LELHIISYVKEEDRQLTEEMGKTIASGAEITSFSNRYVKKDGEIVHLIWSAKWDEKDEVMYCIARDATAMKNAEIKVQKERSMLKAIIDNIPDHIFVVDRDHRTILTNKKFYADYLGKKPKQKHLVCNQLIIFPKEEGLEVMKDNDRLMETGIPVLIVRIRFTTTREKKK